MERSLSRFFASALSSCCIARVAVAMETCVHSRCVGLPRLKWSGNGQKVELLFGAILGLQAGSRRAEQQAWSLTGQEQIWEAAWHHLQSLAI